MMRSMYAGVSGLKAHQTRMDVVGNNIANVNTTGYKTSRATFKEMLSQTLSGAKAAHGNRGGMNPQQVGLGVSLGSIDTDQTQGNLQSTGLGTDLAIEGNGYFVVNNGNQNFYTRAGALTLDENGNLVNASNGYIMQGWEANNSGIVDTNGPRTGIRIPVGDTMQPQASTEAVFTGNLDAVEYDPDPNWEAPTWTSTLDVVDSLGNKHTVTLNFEMTGTNTWSCTASSDIAAVDETFTITFDNSGNIDDIAGGGVDPVDFILNPSGAEQIDLSIDLSSITQAAGENTLDGLYADGYGIGDLDSYSIDNAGVITGSYSNGLTKTIGQIAIANFSNPSGLTRQGDTLYAESQNSGMAQIGAAGTKGRGKISAGTLEMSNVDLSEQFTDMITTQRGFQANSKIITTADQMLQDLVNLKR